MISLCVCTYRPGGLDVLVDSLVSTQPGKEPWELVVIDDHPGRVQRGEAEAYLRQNLPLGYYGHSKPKSYPNTKSGLCNAINTALMHCRGEYTVWVSDYTMLPPYWLRQWELMRQRHPGKNLISGAAIEYYAPPPDNLGDVTTWIQRPAFVPIKPWVPFEFETFYVGMPLEFLLSINGYDERADHCHCWPVSSIVSQARQMDYKLLVDQEVCVHMIEHRGWDFECKTPAPSGCGGEGLWRITHAQSLPVEPIWEVPSPNPFDLKQERIRHGVVGMG